MGNSNSGRGGLPRGVRGQIERLLVGGWAQKEIARFVGVDPKTVWRIAKRLRGSRGEERGASEEAAEDNEEVRCGSCGGLLVATAEYCLACYLNRDRKARPAR